MVGCALIPRFALLAAAGERRELLARPVALAPEAGGPQVVGDVSGAAEAFGIGAGMRVAEALGRCPGLVMIAPDPQRAEASWEQAVKRLEGIGAAVESERAGEAFFGIEGLSGLWGRPERVLERARRALGLSARVGAGPTRICALAAAQAPGRGRGRAAVIVGARDGRAFLSPLPVGLLRDRFADDGWAGINLAGTLERLGVATLGELAALPDAAVADRFGKPGLRALRMARAIEEPLVPRRPADELREEVGLPEEATGAHLQRALELLLDRMLADPARRRRSFRRLRLEARLAAGGGWRIEAAARRATADRERLLLILRPKLASLPAPASRLALRAIELGDGVPEQQALTRDEGERRRGRLSEAVRQARAAAGRGAVLRVLDADPGSGAPERRMRLGPFPEDRP